LAWWHLIIIIHPWSWCVVPNRSAITKSRSLYSIQIGQTVMTVLLLPLVCLFRGGIVLFYFLVLFCANSVIDSSSCWVSTINYYYYYYSLFHAP
jgi:hypothetical protein